MYALALLKLTNGQVFRKPTLNVSSVQWRAAEGRSILGNAGLGLIALFSTHYIDAQRRIYAKGVEPSCE